MPIAFQNNQKKHEKNTATDIKPPILRCSMSTVFQIIIEGKKEDQMRRLFEEIQNRYDLYDNCVLEERSEDKSVIDDNRTAETGDIEL